VKRKSHEWKEEEKTETKTIRAIKIKANVKEEMMSILERGRGEEKIRGRRTDLEKGVKAMASSSLIRSSFSFSPASDFYTMGMRKVTTRRGVRT